MMHDHMRGKSLDERLGGIAAIKAVVGDFVGNVAAGKRINAFFRPYRHRMLISGRPEIAAP